MDAMEQQKPLPRPNEISSREKEDALLSYLIMFAAWGLGLPLPFVSLIAAGVYYTIHKKESRFVSFHAFQALIALVPVAVLNAGAIFWLIILYFHGFSEWKIYLVYAVFTGALNVCYLVFSIIGALKARRGEFYYFYFFGKIAFNRFYGKGAVSPGKDEPAPAARETGDVHNRPLKEDQ